MEKQAIIWISGLVTQGQVSEDALLPALLDTDTLTRYMDVVSYESALQGPSVVRVALTVLCSDLQIKSN